MDRKPEIDRYMLAGPFSWPSVIKDLNERFVPVRHAPTQSQQEEYDLKPYKFIEPGFLVLKSDGSSSLKVDRLTTLHIDWLQKMLAKQGAALSEPIELSKNMQRFSQGNFRELAVDLKARSEAGQATS